ncbi:MAG: hypothetical protein HY814_02545 [Candidatus Riflebacteria bacterium]|nr:hypothetical protein [Candidatus Riflebacteria bacterium]
MTIVSVLLVTLVKSQSDQDTTVTAEELRVMADALSLSGIELMMTCVQTESTDLGLTFLKSRERSLPPTAPYSLSGMFGFTTGTPRALMYTPPLEYPPLRSIALRYAPTDRPGITYESDLRLFRNPTAVTQTLSVGTFVSLAGTTAAGNNGPAILPRPDCRPRNPDNSNYPTGSGTVNGAGAGLRIDAFGNDDLGWIGPVNLSPTCLPNTAMITGVPGSQKLPPPSFIVARDLPDVGSPVYRCFIYCWALRSGMNPPGYYWMSSGRIREVLGTGPSEALRTELVVGSTQIR